MTEEKDSIFFQSMTFNEINDEKQTTDNLSQNFNKDDKEEPKNVYYFYQNNDSNNKTTRKKFKRPYKKKLCKKRKRTKSGETKKDKNKSSSSELNDFYSNENIMIIIKSLVIKSIIKFFNDLNLNVKLIDNNIFLKEFKRDKNLYFLESPISKLLSLKIKDEYRNISDKENYNANIINKILRNPGNENLKKMLNKSLHEYLDIMRHNDEEADKSKMYSSLDNIDTFVDYIMQNFIQINKDINQNKYMTKFLLLFYNFERYLFVKKDKN